MSFTYLQESGEESSAVTFSDIPPSVLLNLNLTAERFFSNGNETESCQSSQSGTMSPPLTEGPGEERSMSFVEASRAKTSQAPVAEQDSLENAQDSGQKWPESLEKYDPDSRSWKTHQCLLFEDSTESLEIFPRWGSMRNGEYWGRSISEDSPTEGIESGYWPTPVSSEKNDGMAPARSLARLYKGDRVARFLCKTWLKLNLIDPELRVCPNPSWQEWRMSWPIGLTDLKPLETDKFQSWQQQHGGF